MRDLRWAVAGLVVGATLLAGCSEKSQANDSLPSTSASPSTEALPPVGPADFPVPDEARTKDAAGAEAFLRYFVDLIDRQRSVPAGQPIRDLGPHCDECLRFAKLYDDAAAAERRIEGGDLVITTLASPLLRDNEALISFGASQATMSLVDAGGVALESAPAAINLASGTTLVWVEKDQSWFVQSLNIG